MLFRGDVSEEPELRPDGKAERERRLITAESFSSFHNHIGGFLSRQ